MKKAIVHPIEWVEVKNYEEMSRLAADLFEQQLSAKKDSVLGLATGNSPLGVYEELIRRTAEGRISFAEATSYNLDEYVGLGAKDETSYHYYMHDTLFSKIDMPLSRAHVPNGEAADLAKECSEYEAAIAASGGLDLQLLGIGVNGHIGFNEPGTSFDSLTHVVELTESTRNKNSEHFPDGEVPEKALTAGLQTIMNAEKIIMLIFGEEKAEAYERLRSGEVTEDFPASVLHLHGNVTVFYGK